MSPKQKADMFVEPENDPREDGPSLGDERSTLVEYLRCQQATLELKWVYASEWGELALILGGTPEYSIVGRSRK